MAEVANMHIEDLKYIVLLSESRNFSETARKSSISQAALSKHIQKVEKSVGTALFDRSKRPLTITLAGQEFIAKAKTILENYEEMMKSMEKYRFNSLQTLNVGIIPIIGRLGFLPFLKQFQESLHINECINFIDRTSGELYNMLSSGEIDVAIMPTPFNNKTHGKFVVYPLFERELCLIVHKTHPLSKRSSVSLDELQNEKFVILDKSTNTYNQIISAYSSANVQFPEAIQYKSPETVLDKVYYDNYISFMTPQILYSYHHYKDELKAIHITPRIKDNISLVMYSTSKFTELQNKFLLFLSNIDFKSTYNN